MTRLIAANEVEKAKDDTTGGLAVNKVERQLKIYLSPVERDEIRENDLSPN